MTILELSTRIVVEDCIHIRGQKKQRVKYVRIEDPHNGIHWTLYGMYGNHLDLKTATELEKKYQDKINKP